MLATSAQDPCLELHALLIPTACCRVSDPPLFLFLLLLVIQPPLQPPAKYLLPELTIADDGKKCVVIDLDETLVHSSFKVAERGGGPGPRLRPRPRPDVLKISGQECLLLQTLHLPAP